MTRPQQKRPPLPLRRISTVLILSCPFVALQSATAARIRVVGATGLGVDLGAELAAQVRELEKEEDAESDEFAAFDPLPLSVDQAGGGAGAEAGRFLSAGAAAAANASSWLPGRDPDRKGSADARFQSLRAEAEGSGSEDSKPPPGDGHEMQARWPALLLLLGRQRR